MIRFLRVATIEAHHFARLFVNSRSALAYGPPSMDCRYALRLGLVGWQLYMTSHAPPRARRRRRSRVASPAPEATPSAAPLFFCSARGESGRAWLLRLQPSSQPVEAFEEKNRNAEQLAMSSCA